MTNTPKSFKAARRELGLSHRQLGEVMKTSPTSIRRYEMSEDKSSHRRIPGPVQVLMDWLCGKRPKLPKERRGFTRLPKA